MEMACLTLDTYRADILTSIEHSKGATTSISYEGSANQWLNCKTQLHPNLSFDVYDG